MMRVAPAIGRAIGVTDEPAYIGAETFRRSERFGPHET